MEGAMTPRPRQVQTVDREGGGDATLVATRGNGEGRGCTAQDAVRQRGYAATRAPLPSTTSSAMLGISKEDLDDGLEDLLDLRVSCGSVD